MADREIDLDALRELLGQTDALTKLVGAQDVFPAAYAAYRAEDASAFQAALKRAELLIYCHPICHWFRIKECVLLCLELCGPPKAIDRAPNPRTLIEGIVQITSDEKAVQQLADAVHKRDSNAFHALITKFKLDPFCHLFCFWVCTVRYRLLCEWICRPGRLKLPELWVELRSAGRALEVFVKDAKVFDAAMAASNANDAEKLGSVIRGGGLFVQCRWICEWFCSWRCALVCLTLIRPFPFVAVEPAAQPREVLDFARAILPLAANPEAALKLMAAVGAGNVEGFGALVKELKLERFVIQLCHWICALRCGFFCRLVCSPIYDHPWFTHVGDFGIYADIDPGSGLTNKAQAGHGGPKFGFFANLSLRGLCPKYDPAHPGEAMAYRFLFLPAGAAAATPITGGFVSEVLVGSRYTTWNSSPAIQSVRIRGTGTTSPTPPPAGPGPTPPDHYIVPDLQGWVTVDPEAFDDAFYGYLMGFASGNGIPTGALNPGVVAGNEVVPPNQRNGTDCAIIFQASRVSTISHVNDGSVAPDYTNSLGKAHINNWPEVSLLDLVQFHTGSATACSPLSTALDVEYTVDHELIGPWSLSVSSASGKSLTNAPPGVAPALPSTGANTPRGGYGVHHEDIGKWPTCSYTVTLTTRRRLTNGLNDDTDKNNNKTFCIGLRK